MGTHRRTKLLALTGAVAAIAAMAMATAAPVAASTVSGPTGSMAGVSCVVGQCVAIGTTGGTASPTAWSLDHGQWGFTAPPVRTTLRPALTSVSCPQLNTCVAVGNVEVGTTYRGVAESLVDGRWHSTPLPAGTPWLSDVSCSSATSCMAVGYATSAPYVGVALEWDGATWTPETLPTWSGGSSLRGVSCVAADDCVAVGEVVNSPVAEHWNGTTWSVSLAPVAQNPESWALLGAVSCASATSCVAIGGLGGCCGTINGYSMTWDGSTWTGVETSPVTQISLSHISCPSASSCIAVGATSNSDTSHGPPRAVVELWDGTTWSQLAVPVIRGQARTELNAVSCSQVSWCVALGSFGLKGRLDQPLVERWNGSALARMWAPD